MDEEMICPCDDCFHWDDDAGACGEGWDGLISECPYAPGKEG